METFLVRVWLPPELRALGPTELRGQIVHVGSGSERPFRGEDELVAFVRSRLEVVALSRAGSTEEIHP
jgi:hypothetical protein